MLWDGRSHCKKRDLILPPLGCIHYWICHSLSCNHFGFNHVVPTISSRQGTRAELAHIRDYMANYQHYHCRGRNRCLATLNRENQRIKLIHLFLHYPRTRIIVREFVNPTSRNASSKQEGAPHQRLEDVSRVLDDIADTLTRRTRETKRSFACCSDSYIEAQATHAVPCGCGVLLRGTCKSE